MRKKKTLRAAAAVAMTGCLMGSSCLSVNSRGLNRFANDLFDSLGTAVSDGVAGVGPGIATFITDTITGLLPTTP